MRVLARFRKRAHFVKQVVVKKRARNHSEQPLQASQLNKNDSGTSEHLALASRGQFSDLNC